MRTLNAKGVFMKNLFRLIGIVALVAVIGFAVVSCGGKK